MLVAAKTYALISEYALICDMRLITREYGIYHRVGRQYRDNQHIHIVHPYACLLSTTLAVLVNRSIL